MMRACPATRSSIMRTSSFTAVALLTLTMLMAGPAWAADKPKKQSTLGDGSGAMLTRDQLRACMTQKARVAQQDDEMAKEQAALEAGQAELMRGGESLKAKLESLDRTKPDDVAAYNEQTQARDHAIDEFQARVSAFNARVKTAQSDRDAYIKSCGNRRYFDEDEAAIKQGK
jgi:hypothetical protein